VDTPLYLSGTTYTLVPDMPACKYIRAYQNRLWCAGASAQKSYIYYSAVGNGDDWDATFGFVAFNQEDGDVVTGIGEPIYETLPVYKRYSSWIVQGKSASNYTPVMVSNSIGATHHRSIRNLLLKNTKNIQVFSSNGIRGGEPGVYSFNGIVVQYLSDNISNRFEVMDTFKTSDRFKSFDSASDWAGGTSVFIDTYTSVNSIQNYVWQGVDTTTSNFASGTLADLMIIDTTTANGAISISYENFEDLNYTHNPVWTVASGVFSAASGKLENINDGVGTQRIYTPNSKNVGLWSWDMLVSPTYRTYVAFMSTYNTDLRSSYVVAVGGSLLSTLYLIDGSGGAGVLCVTGTAMQSNITSNVSVSRDSSGNFTLTTPNGSCSANSVLTTDSGFFQIYYDPESVGYIQNIDNIVGIYKGKQPKGRS